MPTGTQVIAPEASASVSSNRSLSSRISTLSNGDEKVDLYGPCDSAGFAKSLRLLPAGFYAGACVALVAVGSLSLLPLWLAMCRLWATDPLRSIGAVFPLIACIGVLAAWRRLGWRMNGTFWALPLVGLSILLVRAIAISNFAVRLNWLPLGLINPGTMLFLYGVGAVLLFGGSRLLRTAIAPLCLLLLINPVPHIFNSVVDLPLQQWSAFTARAFAHLIGLQPTGVQLRMMFAPDFGMFIAPGCNGVRGSITLGYLALIFGYARRLRPRALILVSLAAFLLGYALNLLRLCVLVVYYRIGVSFPSIQKYGAGVDYAIGCTVFLIAAVGLGMLIRSLAPCPQADVRQAKNGLWASRPESTGGSRNSGYAAAARALCFLALTAAFIVPEIRSATWAPALRPNEQQVLGSFPARVGSYRLIRTWAEHDGNGTIALAMAEYSASLDTGNTLNSFTFGLWVGSGNHFVAFSKAIQGEQAGWTGSFDASAQQELPVHFVTSFYDDGISRQYDAEAICSGMGCSGHLAGSSHGGFFLAVPAFSDIVFATHDKGLPILLRREWPNSDPTPSADLRAQFEADARLFMEQVDLRRLLVQDGPQL